MEGAVPVRVGTRTLLVLERVSSQYWEIEDAESGERRRCTRKGMAEEGWWVSGLPGPGPELVEVVGLMWAEGERVEA